jgi:hypothetical protein
MDSSSHFGQWFFFGGVAFGLIAVACAVVWLMWLLAYFSSDEKRVTGRRLLIATGAFVASAVLSVLLFWASPDLAF